MSDHPTARELIRMAGSFQKAVALTEEIARGGHGGCVRIKEATQVFEAMREYLGFLPAGELEPASRPVPRGTAPEPSRDSITLELRADGLVIVSGWSSGRRDSVYRPMPLSEAIGEISSLAQELQQQSRQRSSDTHAH